MMSRRNSIAGLLLFVFAVLTTVFFSFTALGQNGGEDVVVFSIKVPESKAQVFLRELTEKGYEVTEQTPERIYLEYKGKGAVLSDIGRTVKDAVISFFALHKQSIAWATAGVLLLILVLVWVRVLNTNRFCGCQEEDEEFYESNGRINLAQRLWEMQQPAFTPQMYYPYSNMECQYLRKIDYSYYDDSQQFNLIRQHRKNSAEQKGGCL